MSQHFPDHTRRAATEHTVDTDQRRVIDPVNQLASRKRPTDSPTKRDACLVPNKLDCGPMSMRLEPDVMFFQ